MKRASASCRQLFVIRPLKRSQKCTELDKIYNYPVATQSPAIAHGMMDEHLNALDDAWLRQSNGVRLAASAAATKDDKQVTCNVANTLELDK
jgi:hypothetical protein